MFLGFVTEALTCVRREGVAGIRDRLLRNCGGGGGDRDRDTAMPLKNTADAAAAWGEHGIAGLYTLQVLDGYLLMLVAMTYQVGGRGKVRGVGSVVLLEQFEVN